MDAALEQLAWERAHSCCEYCRLPQEYDDARCEIDHIIARKHHGPTLVGNLALSCFHGNAHKGSDIGGRDPLTRKLTPLFDPRRHKWQRHFRWDGPYLVGNTPVGRATVDVLKVNDALRVALRQALTEEDCSCDWNP